MGLPGNVRCPLGPMHGQGRGPQNIQRTAANSMPPPAGRGAAVGAREDRAVGRASPQGWRRGGLPEGMGVGLVRPPRCRLGGVTSSSFPRALAPAPGYKTRQVPPEGNPAGQGASAPHCRWGNKVTRPK